MDDLIAIGTAALAIFTAALAWSTWHLARGSDRQAELLAMQVSRAHRPVLVPYQRSGKDVNYRGGLIPVGNGPHVVENDPARTDLPTYSSAMLAVENVGMGPALNVRGDFVAPRGTGEVRFPVEGLAAGATTVLTFENWEGPRLEYTGNDQSVSAVIEYDDVAGVTYKTDVTFDIGNNAYRSTVAPEA